MFNFKNSMFNPDPETAANTDFNKSITGSSKIRQDILLNGVRQSMRHPMNEEKLKNGHIIDNEKTLVGYLTDIREDDEHEDESIKIKIWERFLKD